MAGALSPRSHWVVTLALSPVRCLHLSHGACRYTSPIPLLSLPAGAYICTYLDGLDWFSYFNLWIVLCMEFILFMLFQCVASFLVFFSSFCFWLIPMCLKTNSVCSLIPLFAPLRPFSVKLLHQYFCLTGWSLGLVLFPHLSSLLLPLSLFQ